MVAPSSIGRWHWACGMRIAGAGCALYPLYRCVLTSSHICHRASIAHRRSGVMAPATAWTLAVSIFISGMVQLRFYSGIAIGGSPATCTAVVFCAYSVNDLVWWAPRSGQTSRWAGGAMLLELRAPRARHQRRAARRVSKPVISFIRIVRVRVGARKSISSALPPLELNGGISSVINSGEQSSLRLRGRSQASRQEFWWGGTRASRGAQVDGGAAWR